MESHQLDFFGKNSAFILNAGAKNEPFIMLKFIKRKQDNNWERLNEGKAVKINLREMIYILAVLERKVPSFQTVHKFKEETTKISFKWDDLDSNLLWINVADYSRSLLFPETDLLMRMMKHLVDERIEFATINAWNENSPPTNEEEYAVDPIPIPSAPIQHKENQVAARAQYQPKAGTGHKIENNTQQAQPKTNQSSVRVQNQSIAMNNGQNVLSSQPTQPKTNQRSTQFSSQNTASNGKVEVIGTIKMSRPKAVLISLNEYGDLWVPKSAIGNEYDENSNSEQKFLINDWCLNKSNATPLQT